MSIYAQFVENPNAYLYTYLAPLPAPIRVDEDEHRSRVGRYRVCPAACWTWADTQLPSAIAWYRVGTG